METKEKDTKNNEIVKKYCKIGGLSLAILVLVTMATMFLLANFNFHVTSEVGKQFDVNSVWKKDFKAFSTVAGDIDTETVGTYKCLVKIWGLIPMNVTVDVVDTTAPTVELKELSVNYGEECGPEDFILSAIDKSAVTYEFIEAPDTTKLGSQNITIKATDTYNNSTTQTAVLTVKGVIPQYEMEGGSELPLANVFVIDPTIEASYVETLDANNYRKPGEYPVQIMVQGMTETVTLVVKDTTAPSISTSYIKVDKNGTISYKKSIRVTDNCDDASEITLEVDNSSVNLSVVGNYVVHCTATDASGNSVEKDITVQVMEPSPAGLTVEQINGYADNILASIINDSMSLYDKAYAIYKWTRGNIGYLNESQKGDWLQGAYDGMIKKRGDCFTYAATAKFLLERIGLEPVVITKEKESWTSQSNHYWLLLDIGDGYYHFDPTRRADGTWFFMWTDAQILEYSNAHAGSHNFTRSKYPPIN